MRLGVPGRTHGKIYFYFVLSAANINHYSWHYKFYDVEEKKIRDCRIYSPYKHFLKRGFIFKNDTFTSGSLYSVGVNKHMDQVTTNFMYKLDLFSFDNSYRDRNLFFIFNKEKDEFIGSDPDYHFIGNDRYMRFGDQVHEVKKFLLDYYTRPKPQNKTVIVNKNVWNRTSQKERSKIGFIQLYWERVIANNKIRMYTAIKAYKGQDSITKYAAHVRQLTIPKKYLDKLRKKYRNFSLIEFDEWHFNYQSTTQLKWFGHDLNYYKYYNWPWFTSAIFNSSDRIYDRWFSSSYAIFNTIRYRSLSSLGGLNEAKRIFDKNVTPIKNLVEKIGYLSKLMLEQKNYFLHDDSNIINHTFYTQLNKKVQTYGLISTASACTRPTHMVTLPPKKALNLKLKMKSTKKTLSFN